MFKIECAITEDNVNVIEDFLFESIRSNWSILDDRLNHRFSLQGHFEERAEAIESYDDLKSNFDFLPSEVDVIELDDKEWQEAYKEFIQPWSSRALHWVPVWMREEYIVPQGEYPVFLDAGMAFGTGSHETTRLMALRLMDYAEKCTAEDFEKKFIIDAGCGSGILAMSAAKIGFKSVYGFDRDPEAIRVSEENIINNDMAQGDVLFTEAGLEDGLEGRQADLMLANIQADVLQIHADGIVKAVAPGGVLAMSGILVKELDAVKNHFVPLAEAIFKEKFTVNSRSDGEWADLCFFRE